MARRRSVAWPVPRTDSSFFTAVWPSLLFIVTCLLRLPTRICHPRALCKPATTTNKQLCCICQGLSEFFFLPPSCRVRHLITPVGYVPETLVREGKMQYSTLQIVVGFVSCLVTAILLHQFPIVGRLPFGKSSSWILSPIVVRPWMLQQKGKRASPWFEKASPQTSFLRMHIVIIPAKTALTRDDDSLELTCLLACCFKHCPFGGDGGVQEVTFLIYTVPRGDGC